MVLRPVSSRPSGKTDLPATGDKRTVVSSSYIYGIMVGEAMRTWKKHCDRGETIALISHLF